MHAHFLAHRNEIGMSRHTLEQPSLQSIEINSGSLALGAFKMRTRAWLDCTQVGCSPKDDSGLGVAFKSEQASGSCKSDNP